MIRVLSSLGLALLPLASNPALPPEQDSTLDEAKLVEFAATIDEIRARLEIPALSAAIAKDGKLVWASGFGLADPVAGTPATSKTPYHLASLTKTFASAVLLQLMAEGRIGLEDPALDYGVRIGPGESVLVRHLFTHTSDDPAGHHFRYDGNRFGALANVIASGGGVPFGRALQERICAPLGLVSTVPGNAPERHPEVFAALAKPYAYDDAGVMNPGVYPTHFGPSAGLISTVEEVAKFTQALLAGDVVHPELLEMAFTPGTTLDGKLLPYGLGWFAQEEHGRNTIWHYGHWQGNSSLVLLLPDEGWTFVAACNTNGMSRPFPLGSDEVTVSESPFAREFLRAFVLDNPVPEIDWDAETEAITTRLAVLTDPAARDALACELRAHARIAIYTGDDAKAARCLEIFYAAFARHDAEVFGDSVELARVDRVAEGENRTAEFELSAPTTIQIYAIADGRNYGPMTGAVRIEQVETDEVVWEMVGEETIAAGGHPRNRKAKLERELPAGRYRLRFHQRGSHAWGSWDSFPASHSFWGLRVSRAAPASEHPLDERGGGNR